MLRQIYLHSTFDRYLIAFTNCKCFIGVLSFVFEHFATGYTSRDSSILSGPSVRVDNAPILRISSSANRHSMASKPFGTFPQIAVVEKIWGSISFVYVYPCQLDRVVVKYHLKCLVLSGCNAVLSTALSIGCGHWSLL